MSVSGELSLVTESLRIGLLLLAVPVGSILLVGVLTSLIQAVTQLQDPSLSFVPKLITAAVVIWIMAPWLLGTLARFSTTLWLHAVGVSG